MAVVVDLFLDKGGAVYNVMSAAFNAATTITERIQLALDLAGADSLGESKGAVVYLPPAYVDGATVHSGIYTVDASLLVSSNVTITGGGPGTVLRWSRTTDDAQKDMFKPKHANMTNVTISNMTIDGNAAAHTTKVGLVCITLSRNLDSNDAPSRIRISGVTFRNVHTAAVHADSRTGWLSDVQIADCVVEKSEGGGFTFFGKFRDFVIANNRLNDLCDDAVAVQGVLLPGVHLVEFIPESITIRNNVITGLTRRNAGSTPHGIMVFAAHSVAIAGNIIDNTIASAITVQDFLGSYSRSVTISGNVIQRAGEANVYDRPGIPSHGIDIRAAKEVCVLGNSIQRSRGSESVSRIRT